MSFVSKILQVAGHMEKKAVHEQVETLNQKLYELELEVHQLAEDKYVNFRTILNEAENLSDEVQKIRDDLVSAEQKINTEIKDQLGVSTGEFQSLSQQLSEANVKLSALEYLLSIQQLLEESERAVENKKYSEAAVAFCKLDDLFKQPLTSSDNKIPILVEMRTELRVQRERLSYQLSELWASAISWNVQGDNPSRPNEVITNVREINLTVSCVGEARQELVETVEALHITGNLSSKMVTLAKRVKDYLLPFVVEQNDFVMDEKTFDSTKVLTLSKAKSNSQDASSIDDATHYHDVFSNLLKLLEHLDDMFLHIDYGWEESVNMTSASSLSTTQMDSTTVDSTYQEPSFKAAKGKGILMNLLGAEIAACLLDDICRTALAKAVPSSAKDLDGFNAVISCTQNTQEKLVALGFIQPDNRILLEYVENINALFANKKCQLILEQARDLMTSSLHESVAVAEDKPVGEWPPLVPGGVKKVLEQMGDHLSENTLRLPKCRISQNIDALMRSAYETLQEATESSPECAMQMFYAVRGMFETYCHIVPTHHSQSLEEFPQVAALHHNNCMFLAHHLLTLGHQFSSVLHVKDSDSLITFVDLVCLVRQIGLNVFLKQIARQRSILDEALDGAKGFTGVEDSENHERCNRAIKQVLLQLSHLQKIWKPVLPINVYKKTMGQLIKCVVERITNAVSQLEDIAKEAANNLIALLAPVEEECGQLLISPGEVPAAELLRHAPRWARLTELKLLLDAGLSDIGDRWAEGKGPLAAAFSPKEVRQMVRALFQNTDRRAAVLATIVQ